MTKRGVTESVVEDAALAWLESLGYTIKHGPDITPGELVADRVNSDILMVPCATRYCRSCDQARFHWRILNVL
jgi:hypothetical protein